MILFCIQELFGDLRSIIRKCGKPINETEEFILKLEQGTEMPSKKDITQLNKILGTHLYATFGKYVYFTDGTRRQRKVKSNFIL